MSDFVNELANQIFECQEFKETTFKLFKHYIHERYENTASELDETIVRKLAYSSQVFYKSNIEKLKQEGATILSMLLETSAMKHPEIIPIANYVFAETGDFPNNSLLSEKFSNFDFNFNYFTNAKLAFRKQLNEVEELDFTLTDYQRSLWDDLEKENDVLTVAPTSAGKTHIILSFLINQVLKSDGAFAAIIVPTRALISEVAGKIFEISTTLNCLDQIEVTTVFKDKEYKDKTFFVMTQERLYEVLEYGGISFDYLFIDEAHNISDRSRGVLLHLTLEKFLNENTPQIIVSMPSQNYQNSFSDILKDFELSKNITKHSPVSKIIISVTPKGRNLVLSRLNEENVVEIPKTFKGDKLANIVFKLGQNETNIVYRNKTNECEDTADKIASLITNKDHSEKLEEAADYVEQFIHDRFSLAPNLRKGVAFHYGPLPQSIRVMIENLAKEEKINYICCTSTLAEGVNLPVKNLFIENPFQPVLYGKSKRIEDVKLNNITGRAGRMMKHFSGNVFLVRPDKWQFKDYFEEQNSEEPKIPSYFKSLNEENLTILKALNGEIDHDSKDQFPIYTIANKLIYEFSTGQLDSTLSSEFLTLSSKEIKQLKTNIEKAYNNLKVSAITLEANPTIGYIQQNKLFDFLSKLDSYDDWHLPHPMSTELYTSLRRIAYKLNEFGLYNPTKNHTIDHICKISRRWIQGKSLKGIIQEQISSDKRYAEKKKKNSPSINKSVRTVMEIINSDITFRLSRALKCYQLLFGVKLAEEKIESKSVNLHTYIEVGASQERIISLINFGLSREASIEIHNTLENSIEIKSKNDLIELFTEGKLNSVHKVIWTEINNLIN